MNFKIKTFLLNKYKNYKIQIFYMTKLLLQVNEYCWKDKLRETIFKHIAFQQ